MSLSMALARQQVTGVMPGGAVSVRTLQRIATSKGTRRRGHAGDPGLFGFIGDALGGLAKGAVGAVTGFIGSGGNPIGAVAGGLSGIGILKGSTPATTAGLPNITTGGIAGGALTGPTNCAGISWGGKCIGGAWGGGTASVGISELGPMEVGTGGLTPGYAPANGKKKYRRMNPLNPKALSRSMRRVASFSRATRSIEKELGKLGRAHGPKRAPVSRRRGSASCSCK